MAQTNLITFNSLLKAADIDLKDVYLVRHKDTRVSKRDLRKRRSSPYELWMDEKRREQFEVYQKLQGKGVFKKRSTLASFVVTPCQETLFVGIYTKLGDDGKWPSGLKRCPVSDIPVSLSSHYFYELDLDERLKEYRGKVVISWGKGTRNWVHRADSNDKEIVEIRKDIIEEPFPGFEKFDWRVADIENIPHSWQEVLRSYKGIYVQQCMDCGRLYVGKADGVDGFIGRFRNYSRNGHGGNEGMKAHQHRNFYVRILEVFPTPPRGDTNEIEIDWKIKLGAREKWGLNKN